MNTYVTELLGAGADAMTNMYEVVFTLPSVLKSYEDAAGKLRIRADAFTPPNDEQQSYEVHWKTVSVTRPAAKINLDRSFQISFRLDANYDIYKALVAWKKLTSSGALGYASQDLNGKTGSIFVKAFSDAANKITDTASISGDPAYSGDTIKWSYKDVWIPSISNPDFSNESSEPAKITVTFRFGTFEDQSNKN